MNNKYSLPKDGGLIAESAPRDIIHRYEKILTRVYENENQGVQYVADTIVEAIRGYAGAHADEHARPFVLGLTTGRTPLELYAELVKRHKEGAVSFRDVAVYSLDEFYPIDSTEQQSRNYRIHEDFLNHIDIRPENIHIPDGTIPAERISEYCAAYDRAIEKIDLMIMGVGEDGQIGFNEPGSYVKSRTRLVQLTHNTRKVQSGAFFGLENTPKMAITMGIDTIMRAKRIILMAWGETRPASCSGWSRAKSPDRCRLHTCRPTPISRWWSTRTPHSCSRASRLRGWSAPAAGPRNSSARPWYGSAAWWTNPS